MGRTTGITLALWGLGSCPPALAGTAQTSPELSLGTDTATVAGRSISIQLCERVDSPSFLVPGSTDRPSMDLEAMSDGDLVLLDGEGSLRRYAPDDTEECMLRPRSEWFDQGILRLPTEPPAVFFSVAVASDDTVYVSGAHTLPRQIRGGAVSEVCPGQGDLTRIETNRATSMIYVNSRQSHMPRSCEPTNGPLNDVYGIVTTLGLGVLSNGVAVPTPSDDMSYSTAELYDQQGRQTLVLGNKKGDGRMRFISDVHQVGSDYEMLDGGEAHLTSWGPDGTLNWSFSLDKYIDGDFVVDSMTRTDDGLWLTLHPYYDTKGNWRTRQRIWTEVQFVRLRGI